MAMHTPRGAAAFPRVRRTENVPDPACIAVTAHRLPLGSGRSHSAGPEPETPVSEGLSWAFGPPHLAAGCP